MGEKINSLNVIYLQEAWQDYYGETTWCADRITDEDAKFVNIEYIKKVFKDIVNERGLIVPSIAIIKIVDELEKLENKNAI